MDKPNPPHSTKKAADKFLSHRIIWPHNSHGGIRGLKTNLKYLLMREAPTARKEGWRPPNTYPTPGNGLDRPGGRGENKTRQFYKPQTIDIK